MTYLYFSLVPFFVKDETVIPETRAAEIENTNNASHKTQKYYVWKLLEKALLEKFGKRMDELDFVRNENGKWECNGLFFSLSHSKEAVAVAVSDKPCGVDIEYFKYERFGASLAKKIMNEKEFSEYSSICENNKNEFVLQKWTEKESIFKMLSGKTFIPCEIDTFLYNRKFLTAQGYGIACTASEGEDIVCVGSAEYAGNERIDQ